MPVQNLLSLWNGWDLRRQIIVVGATLAMFLAILGLSRMATTPGMALLYAGLDSSAAGDVIRALDARGAVYQVQGDSIRVEATQRDSLRMILAAEGLPATGVAGYELLDGLSGFGTTSQMFDAAYLRAKEGELARTIVANSAIRTARVHIALAPAQAFQRDLRATASVTVSTASAGLTASQAKALRHLISAAVAGMRPEDVSVIDTVAGLIPAEDEGGLGVAGGDAKAAELKRNLERLLAARVGIGRAVVEVSVEVVNETESVTERRFDPQGRVAISSDTEERSNSATQPGADVTVASNLPEGDAGAGAQGKSDSTETRERVNYEVSETSREVRRTPGAIKRLSVAVLVDGEMVTAADGSKTWQPRPDEELGDLRELVASAAGIDEARGDVLTLKSLAFEPIGDAGTTAAASMLSEIGPLDIMTLIQLAVLSVVALVLGLFVIRPLISKAGKAPELPEEVAPLTLPGSGRTGQALTGEIADFDLPELPTVSTSETQAEAEAKDPMQRLRRLIEERQAESVEILRGWMEADEEKA